MSFLGTLEGIGAGDPMGSFLRSNNAALDQSYNQAAGKALISMFSGQVPGAQPMQGPQGAMPPQGGPPQGPQSGGMPPGGPQMAGGAPAAVPGAQPMPPAATQSMPFQGGPGSGSLTGPNPPPAGTGTFTGPQMRSPQGQQQPQMQQALQQQQQLKAQLQQLQAQRGGPPQGPQGPQGGGPQPGQPQGQQAQIPPQLQQQMQQMRQQLQQLSQGVQQAQGRLDWKQLVQQVVQANPGASPMVVAGAVQKLIPLMNASSLQDWRDIQGRLRQDQFGEKVVHDQAIEITAQQNADTRAAGQVDTARHRGVAEEQANQRIQIARDNLGRLTVQGQIRNDQRFKDFEWRKQQAEQKAARAKNNDDRTQALQEWKKLLDDQKTYMNTIINADKMVNNKEEKNFLLKQNEDWYNQQRRDMSRKVQGSFSDKFTPAETMPPSMSTE
jgi:hypothetical protein